MTDPFFPAGRFDLIGEAARFAPSAGSVTVRFIGVELGLAFVATRASGSALAASFTSIYGEG
jgi:hypothetical protein